MSNPMYRLKGRFGQPIDLYIGTQVTVNVETGKVSKTETKWKINSAIVINTEDQKTSQAPNFVKSRNFSNAAVFDMVNKIAYVEIKDLPNSYVLNTEDSIYITEVKYTIRKFEVLQDGIKFSLERTLNQESYPIKGSIDNLFLTDLVEYEITNG